MGAELELALGYDGQLRPMGVFVCSEITLSGWPATMTLRAHAAPWEGTPKGKSDLQTQKPAPGPPEPHSVPCYPQWLPNMA